MPRKPMRPCMHPGCPTLSDNAYCPVHQREHNAFYNRYVRDPATKGRYGTQWTKVRKRKLATNPLCEECMRAGRTTPANEVHHILPLADGGTHAMGNLMSLCKPCHSRFTLAETAMKRRSL